MYVSITRGHIHICPQGQRSKRSQAGVGGRGGKREEINKKIDTETRDSYRPSEAPSVALSFHSILILNLHLWLKPVWVALYVSCKHRNLNACTSFWGHIHDCRAALNMQEGRGVMRGFAGGEIEEDERFARRGKERWMRMKQWWCERASCKAQMMGELSSSG